MEDTLSNYEIDERERKESQKQRAQRSHGLDERYSSKEGFGRDDQENIKNILRNAPKSSKPCQQWDAQTQSYVEVGSITESDKFFDDTVRSLYENEEVTNPKHYDKVGFGIQPLEYITANELDFLEGNVIKYVSRYPHKGGVNDLLKARTYIEKLIERESLKNE